MFKMTRNNTILSIAALSLPVLFLFQNCTHTRKIQLTQVPLFQSTTISETLILSPVASISSCEQIVASDILLKVSSISSNSENPLLSNFEIIDKDKSISLEKLNLKIKAKTTEQIQTLVIHLQSQGNKILTNDSIVVDVKTSADEQPVVRASLKNAFQVKEGQTYNLVLDMNPNKLITPTKKNHCQFKPLVKAAELAALQ